MLGTRTMQSHAPNRLKDAALIAGCCMLLGGCAVFHSKSTSPEKYPWAAEMGTADTATTPLPAEAAPMGHYLKAEVALTQGDYDIATKEYELAVVAEDDIVVDVAREHIVAGAAQDGGQQFDQLRDGHTAVSVWQLRDRVSGGAGQVIFATTNRGTA